MRARPRRLPGLATPAAAGLLIAALLAVGAGLGARAAGLMQWLERPTVDARFALRGGIGAPRDITIVAIDENSLAVLPRFPFPRKLDAEAIERLHAAGARLIVSDLAFDRPTDLPDDAALNSAATRAAPIIFATTLIESPAGEGEAGSGETEVLGGNANLERIGDEAAAADLPADPDGVVRHTYGAVKGLPTIAAAVARRLDRNPPPPASYEGGWIDFRGGPGSFHAVPFVNVLHGDFDRSLVRGRVVILGATAPVLHDEHSTAGGSLMSGPELAANAVATALAGFPLRNAPASVAVLLVLALAALAPLAVARFGSLGALGALLLGGALWSLATQLSFDANTMLDFSDPLLALTVGAVAAMALGLAAERRERRELRLRFAAGSGEVVDEVLHVGRPLAPTAIIGGYRIEEVLARGGMAVVYRATQLALKRPVAIKLITPDHAQDHAFRERFEQESKIAASIEHASIIPVYEAGADNGLLFIAMRLVDGADLGALLERGGPLEPLRAAQLLVQIAGALDAAHAAGLVHRDVKPANILVALDEPEHAYLTDFGVAKHVGEPARITRAGQWVGTLDYLAPEQIRCEEVTAAADVYALAGVLYHCLTGQPPFVQANDAATLWAHLSAPPPQPSRLRAELPRALDAVIARGLAKLPQARFRSAGELARACTRALGLEELEPAPAAAGPSGARNGEQRAGVPGDAAATLISEP